MKFRWDKKYLYWGITALLVIGASICLFFLMFRGANFKDGVAQIISIAMPIIDGLVLAYLLTPVLNFIEKQALRHVFKKGRQALTDKQKKYLRMSAIVLTLLFVVLIIYAFSSVVLPQLFKSIQSIVFQFPVYVNNLTAWLQKVLADNPEVESYINDLINTYTPELRSWMNDTLLPQMNAVLKVVSNYAFNVLKALWNMIIGLIISVYIMGSKEKFIGQAKKAIYSAMDIKRANSLLKTFGLYTVPSADLSAVSFLIPYLSESSALPEQVLWEPLIRCLSVLSSVLPISYLSLDLTWVPFPVRS